MLAELPNGSFRRVRAPRRQSVEIEELLPNAGRVRIESSRLENPNR